MHRLSAGLLVAFALLFVPPLEAQAALYAASSRNQGEAFDLVVAETKRVPNRSYLSVAGFHKRTAPGARWLMCVFVDIAVQRGYSHWIVVYPPEDSEVLVLGLANSPDTSITELLGEDFSEKHVLGDAVRHVAPFLRFCRASRK